MRGCRRWCRRTKRYGVPASAGGAFVVAETLEIRKRVARARAAPTEGGTPLPNARAFGLFAGSGTVPFVKFPAVQQPHPTYGHRFQLPVLQSGTFGG